MAGSVDKSLLDRLKALRGASADVPDKTEPSPAAVPFDSIERKKTPTREETLADRLKKLRDGAGEPNPAANKTILANKATATAATTASNTTATPDATMDEIFKTDDTTLEELLDDEDDGTPHNGPSDAEVQKLLDQLEAEMPRDDDDDEHEDVEPTNKEVDDVIARYRDELEVEKSLVESDDDEQGEETFTEDDSVLPSVPDDIDPGAEHPSSANLGDLQSRMASLRASSVEPDLLPSVPSSKPSGKPVNRLTSRGKYTDDDVDSWCTVCLEDATLKCLGCDGDPYCARCWKEMHVGSAAAFDDRSHKAVQFTRDRKKKEKKVALGAS